MKLRASASSKVDNVSGVDVWHHDQKILDFRTENRKRALTLALNAVQREWPDAQRYSVEILGG